MFIGFVWLFLYLYSMQKPNKHTDNEVALSKKEYDKLVAERDDFKRQLAELKRMIFGSKSERYVPVDSNQL